VEVTVGDRGTGAPVLLLHGGAGPASVAGYADRLAADVGVRVLTPTHPGYDGTPGPRPLTGIGDLAALYVRLLEELDLDGVTVVGNSIGGWIAAEMGLLRSPRIAGLVLVDAVGIEVPGHPVVDFFALDLSEVARLSYADPEAFRIDLAALPPAARELLAANRAALAHYAGPMSDPELRERLGELAVPTLVIWGDGDGIVDPTYGRAYAAAIPGARFELLEHTGHLPQLESPELLTGVLAGVLPTREPRRRPAR
jgi:pimeloyl-ACP methyl ester carboxylesterase